METPPFGESIVTFFLLGANPNQGLEDVNHHKSSNIFWNYWGFFHGPMIISEFLAHQRSKEVLCFVFQPWQDTPSMTCVPLWQVGGGLLDRKLPKLLAYLVSSSIPKKSWLGCHYSHGWSTSKVRSAACGAVVKSWRLSKRQRLWRSQKGIMIVNKRGNGTPNHRKSLCEWLVTWDSGTSPVFLVEGVLAMDPKFRIVPWGLLQIWEMGRPFNLDPGSWNMFHCHQSYTRVSFQCGFLNGVPKLQMLPKERSGTGWWHSLFLKGRMDWSPPAVKEFGEESAAALHPYHFKIFHMYLKHLDQARGMRNI